MLTKPRLWWMLAALIASVLAANGWRLWSHRSPPVAGAQWIWAAETKPLSGKDATGTPAFLTARDFEVDMPTTGGRLVVLGDEEYLAYLDGVWIGANRYRLGASADVYALPELSSGMHRLAIEARSATGRGAVLAALFLEDSGKPAVVTDEQWSVFDRARAGLVEGWSQVDVGQAPRVWGSPPMGRWRRLELADQEPMLASSIEGAAWGKSMISYSIVDDEELRRSGSLIDFGAVHSGFLEIFSPAPAEARRQLRFGETLDDLHGAAPECFLLAVPRSSRWRDSGARRFRYAWIEGPLQPENARLLLVDANRVKIVEAGDLGRERTLGPYGLEPPSEGRWLAHQRR